MMLDEDADMGGEAQQRNTQDAMIHLITAVPDGAPALLMDVLTAHQFNRVRRKDASNEPAFGGVHLRQKAGK